MTPFDVGMLAVTLLMVAALGMSAFRLLRGPTAADRVVALDACTVLAIGLSAAIAVRVGNAVMLDVAMVLALVAFLGTVALASLIRGEKPETEASAGSAETHKEQTP